MRTRGVSFRYAVELLRADHPSLVATGRIVRKDTTTRLDAPVTADAGDQDILRQVVDYYHETLKASPEALRYLESRGLTHPEMIAHFRLGFANRTLGYRLPEKNRKAGAEMRGRLQKLGILRESGHEHFNGSVMVPIFDSRATYSACTAARSRPACARARRCIFTYPARTAACGTKKRWPRQKRSSSANR